MALNLPFIGQLDRKIKIYKLKKTQNAVGEERVVRELLVSPFAFLAENSGSEVLDGKEVHLISSSYVIRYNSTVLKFGKDYQLEDAGLYYNIEHVSMLGRRKFLSLKVSASE